MNQPESRSGEDMESKPVEPPLTVLKALNEYKDWIVSEHNPYGGHVDGCPRCDKIKSLEKLIDDAFARSETAAITSPTPANRYETILDHAEVIGNVTAALLDLNVTYYGNQATFTFESTNNPMSYIHKARSIVEERLALIRANRHTTEDSK